MRSSFLNFNCQPTVNGFNVVCLLYISYCVLQTYGFVVTVRWYL